MANEIKLLIVDDEQLIRVLLKKSVRWEDMGVRLVGEAENAEQALEAAERLRPDLVITDICMSNMDGVNLADILIKRYPAIKVVILTGYDEFEYAKRSIRAGVSDFLLKPINAKEIRQAVFRLKEEILREHVQAKEIAALRSSAPEREDDSGAEGQTDHRLIPRVKKHIMEHLGDSELSLASVAKKFYLSTGYLSRNFKEETGMNFVPYLLRARMERAAELLKTTELHGYQVGEAVGIPDSHYFSICFKKYTGFSVSSYKKENRYKN